MPLARLSLPFLSLRAIVKLPVSPSKAVAVPALGSRLTATSGPARNETV
jgi:hypothetical protein